MVFSSSKKWRNIIFTALLVVALLPALTSLSSASTEWLPGIITTVAGTGTLGYGGDGGAATSAQLRNPYGVAVDSGGNLFIADYENHRIRKVAASTGIITTVAGTGTAGYGGDSGAATAAKLNYPSGIAVDSGGNLFIADYGNRRIRKVAASTGIITTVAGTGTYGYSGDGAAATSAQLANPSGVAVDSGGNLFIADTENNRIRRVNASDGIISTVAGTGTLGYGGDGAAATSAQLRNPYGVAVDSGGNLFIADYENHRIRKVAASTGIITTVAGTGTAGYGGDGGAATSAQLRYPNGVVVDSGGNLFIADSNNHRIRKVDAATQVIITVAGTGEEGFMGVEAGYSGDGGPAASAQLANPSGVALDSAGILFIADRGNNRIRKVEQLDPVPPATVTVSPDLFYGAATAPASFSGTAADDSLGMGLDANSTTFSLQRGSDAKYWTGSAWQSGVAWLATNHNSTTGGAPVNWTSSAAVPAWADGSYTIQAKATDKAGNFATGAAAGFTFDSTAPVITFSPMLGFAGPQKAQQVSWNATDANIAPDSVVLEGFDGTSWLPLASAQPAQGNYSWAVPAVDTSAAKVRVTASDLAGNVNALESGTFVIDSTNPTVSMNDIPGTVSYLQVMAGTSSDSAPGQVDKVQAAVSDNTSGTYWNGAAWVGEETWLETLSNAAGTNWAYIMPALVQDHSYIVKARSLDKSGNMSPLATDNFTFAAAQTSGIPGDANGDGQVNALDITKTERIIAGLD